MFFLRIFGLKLFLLLFLLSVILYANSLNGDFIMDDNHMIVNQEDIKHFRTLPLIFTSDLFKYTIDKYENKYYYYRPMLALSFAVDYFVWKLNPFGYHLTNIIIHSFNAFLVFYLIYLLFADYLVSLLTAVLFIIHPLQTESVGYITGRSELLVSLFVLLSVVVYLKYLKLNKNIFFGLSLVFFVFSLFSREAGFLVLMPFLTMFLDFKAKSSLKKILIHSGCFFAALAVYVKLRLSLFPVYGDMNKLFVFSGLNYLNFLHVLMEYVKLSILPFSLHFLRTTPAIKSVQIVNSTIYMLISAVVVIGIYMLARRKKYVLIFGIGWFLMSFSYLFMYINKYGMGMISMEEHWAYLPLIGLFLILAYCLSAVKNKTVFRILTVILILYFSIFTLINNRQWKDELFFYRYNMPFTDSSLKRILKSNYAIALNKRGLYQEAISQIKDMISYNPNDWAAYVYLGNTLKMLKEYEKAKEAYKKALEIDYFCWQANQQLKLLAEERGGIFNDDIGGGLSADEIKIVSYMRLGEFDSALSLLKEKITVSAQPNFYTLAGIALGKTGKIKESIIMFNAALEIDKDYMPALYNLMVAYNNIKDFDKVSQLVERINNGEKNI